MLPLSFSKSPDLDSKLHGYPTLADIPAPDAFVMVGGFDKNESNRSHDVIVVQVRVRYLVKMHKLHLIHLIMYQDTGCTKNCGKVEMSVFLSWEYLGGKESLVRNSYKGKEGAMMDTVEVSFNVKKKKATTVSEFFNHSVCKDSFFFFFLKLI